MSYYSGHFSFPSFHYASVPLCMTLQILQTLQSPLRAPFVFISFSLAMVSLCLFHLEPVTPCFLYFLSPPQFTVSNFGSVPTFSIFLCFIPFVSLIGVPSFVCLFLPLHLSPSVLLLFISLYAHTISIFIFSSLHFTCLFPILLCYLSVYSAVFHIKPLTPFSIEEDRQETSLFTPLSLSRAQDLMSKVNLRCKIPTTYRLQSQVYLPAEVFAKIIQCRHNLF